MRLVGLWLFVGLLIVLFGCLLVAVYVSTFDGCFVMVYFVLALFGLFDWFVAVDWWLMILDAFALYGVFVIDFGF